MVIEGRVREHLVEKIHFSTVETFVENLEKHIKLIFTLDKVF